MLKAIIFDLDGTLVKTEALKAISYARAAMQLCPFEISERDVIDAFKDVVGLPRQEVASALMDQFNLTNAASKKMDEYGVTNPWQAYVQIRLGIYEEMLSDPNIIRENKWDHTMDLLHASRENGCKLGLATMSYCSQVTRILDILELSQEFDFVASRDDVRNGKPDPEIYLLVANQLDVLPKDCLVIEDSPAGVEAALNAKMWVVAVSTPFTRELLHASGLLPSSHIVDDSASLPGVVRHVASHDADVNH